MLQRNLGGFFQGGGKKMVYMKEHPEFEKQFVVYSNDEGEARRVLTLPLLDAIYELRNRWNAPLRIVFDGNKVYIALSFNGRDFFETKLQESVLESQVLKRVYGQLSLCFRIIEHLGFDIKDKKRVRYWEDEEEENYSDTQVSNPLATPLPTRNTIVETDYGDNPYGNFGDNPYDDENNNDKGGYRF